MTTPGDFADPGGRVETRFLGVAAFLPAADPDVSADSEGAGALFELPRIGVARLMTVWPCRPSLWIWLTSEHPSDYLGCIFALPSVLVCSEHPGASMLAWRAAQAATPPTLKAPFRLPRRIFALPSVLVCSEHRALPC
ncbi:hypothetical protein B0H14DRAFT_3489617 [Mycena olivaceomarginata]|nr:hypothetical protein B0H14DRAFT_3489617 [Mycena olivaceomarginata]